jgi:hypothetical protein
MAAPYTATPPGGAEAARAMMANSVPMDLYQAGANSFAAQSAIMRTGGPIMPSMPAGSSGGANLPIQPVVMGMQAPPSGAVAMAGGGMGGGMGCPPSGYPSRRTQVRFAAPTGMKVSWFAGAPSGAALAPTHIDVPGRYNFLQAAVYRLKLSDLPGRPGVELYPTLEVVPSNARTDAFLAHSSVPVVFTEEDLEQVAAGHFLVKVIYLPDPQYQDLATTGPDEVVSTRLDPGVNPIEEAHRRGNILVIIRLGNTDLELANTPAMDAPMQRPGMMPTRPMMGAPGGSMVPPPNGMAPVSRLPEASSNGQTGALISPISAVTPAQLASQPADSSSTPSKKANRWWSPSN